MRIEFMYCVLKLNLIHICSKLLKFICMRIKDLLLVVL